MRQPPMLRMRRLRTHSLAAIPVEDRKRGTMCNTYSGGDSGESTKAWSKGWEAGGAAVAHENLERLPVDIPFALIGPIHGARVRPGAIRPGCSATARCGRLSSQPLRLSQHVTDSWSSWYERSMGSQALPARLGRTVWLAGPLPYAGLIERHQVARR